MTKDKELILIEKIRSGETDCYSEFVDAYSEDIFALIYKMVGNREDAEEMAQDVFVKGSSLWKVSEERVRFRLGCIE